MNMEIIFKQALNDMDTSFTSHEFNRKAKAYNPNVKGSKAFLQRNCTHTSRYWWSKKEAEQTTPIEVEATEIEEAIKLLKSKGYRIQKLVQKYEEV